MKIGLMSVLLFASHVALACDIGDKVISRYTDYDRQTCTTSGYCYAYDYNRKTGRYERYYGYHRNCRGERTRNVERTYCERRDGQRYRDEKAGYWSSCRPK